MDIAKIKKLVNKYTKKYSTNNPYELADYLNIRTFIVPLGDLPGCYKYLKRHKCIFLNSDIEDEGFKRFVMAHELGHAIMHPKENCYYIENYTYLKSITSELEANQFAAQLLIPDDVIYENSDLTIQQLSRLLGYSEKITMLRFETCGLY